MRRRLAWAGGALVVLGAAGVVIALAPGGKRLPPDRLRPGTVVRPEREVTLTPAMRRGITDTLQQFVPAAVARRDPALAWSLAGPGLRGSTTRKAWLAGRTPVFPFPVRQERFDGWRPLYAYRDRVGLDLLLHARPETRRGAIAVSVDVARTGRRWLVDSWYVSAVFTGPDERPWVTGSPDFQAEAKMADSYTAPKFADAKLSPLWFAVPGAILSMLLLVPVVVIVSSRRRDRRARAAWGSSGGSET